MCNSIQIRRWPHYVEVRKISTLVKLSIFRNGSTYLILLVPISPLYYSRSIIVQRTYVYLQGVTLFLSRQQPTHNFISLEPTLIRCQRSLTQSIPLDHYPLPISLVGVQAYIKNGGNGRVGGNFPSTSPAGRHANVLGVFSWSPFETLFDYEKWLYLNRVVNY